MVHLFLLSDRLHARLVIFFFLMLRPPPISTLFPYTPLFRSRPRTSWRGTRARAKPCSPVSAAGWSTSRRRSWNPPYVGTSRACSRRRAASAARRAGARSEEHTSELQSPCNPVCRLLLEQKHAAADRALREGRHAGQERPHGNQARHRPLHRHRARRRHLRLPGAVLVTRSTQRRNACAQR